MIVILRRDFLSEKKDIFREGASHLIKMRDRSLYLKHAEYFSVAWIYSLFTFQSPHSKMECD